MQTAHIVRRTLADEASDRLRAWIVGGRISASDRLSEPELARTLGISRTPLRAAIARLAREGLLEMETGRGFRVTPLNATLVHEIYPILGALEAMALRITPADRLPDPAALRALNAQLAAKNATRSQLYAADRKLHELISSGCTSARLLSLLEEHKRQAERFDGAFRRGVHARTKSHAEHEAIITAIEKRRISRAASLIEEHYLGGIPVVLDWLVQQEKP
jgi:DNA-binding GntR family transcriptional regulator